MLLVCGQNAATSYVVEFTGTPNDTTDKADDGNEWQEWGQLQQWSEPSELSERIKCVTVDKVLQT